MSNAPISRADLIKLARDLAMPIDVDDLIGEGVLERRGAWCRVLDWERLPDHARHKVTALRHADDHVEVKFAKGQRKAAALYKRLTGDDIS
jgi:hypothetical protein